MSGNTGKAAAESGAKKAAAESGGKKTTMESVVKKTARSAAGAETADKKAAKRETDAAASKNAKRAVGISAAKRAADAAAAKGTKQTADGVHTAMPDEDVLYGLAEFFKLFGDTTRMKILCALFPGELCVCDIASAVGLSQSAVSHQLRVLKGGKLVKFRRDGKTIYYSLDDAHVVSIIRQGTEHVCE